MNLRTILAAIAAHFTEAHALDHLTDKVKALLLTEIITNPALSRDAAIALAEREADNLLNAVMRYPTFAVLGVFLEPVLRAAVAPIAGQVYDKLIAGVVKAAGVQPPAPDPAAPGGAPAFADRLPE